jgi:hypothetical protein
MRKRILIVLSVMFVFGLFASVFALSRTTVANDKTASCCPMHKQNNTGASASTEKSNSCCDMADCCKDGKCSMGGDCCKDKDSCPMKKNTETSTAQGMDMSKVTVSVSSDDCCKPGADCCKGGACCRKKS